MDKLLTELVERLTKALGDRLVSVVLYGSAAAGEHQAAFSDYNVLCVLSALTPRELAAAADVFRWWREKGSPAPLLLTEEELATSTDCFAIEFHDIKAHHRILYGRDLISALQVDDCFYRAQVEHELRAKLLRLRQKASGMLSQPDLLRRLLVDSLSTFCVLFRHALHLHGAAAPMRKREIVAAAGLRFGFDAGAFEKVLDIRDQRIKPRQAEPVGLLEGYLAAIDRVIQAVDRLEK
jgi:predicted nucleotidyltransferase